MQALACIRPFVRLPSRQTAHPQKMSALRKSVAIFANVWYNVQIATKTGQQGRLYAIESL